VPLLGLLVVARAVLVPSGVRRTLALSLLPLPAVLAVHLAVGEVHAEGLGPYPGPVFRTLLVWDQVYLALAAGLATLASRVNFALRRRVYEAMRVDRYVLEEKIGEGAMGEVYRARHALLRRPTAVKILRPEIAGERNFQRFEREVRLTSRLEHPNAIQVYDYGTTPDGLFYYAMELLDGADLECVVALTGPFPVGRALHVLRQAAGALSEAHAKGMVHRDVKPSNVILCRQGLQHDVVKVMDFGLVKDVGEGVATLTDAGEVCGSPHTISPEALRGEEVTGAADLYALACVGVWLLTGKAVFDAKTIPLFLAAHLRSEPLLPSARGVEVPAPLESLLARCLAKDPASRPSSAAALEADLVTLAAAHPWTEADATSWWRDHGSAVVAR
jgi:serine/threonine-protein kinase